MRTNDKLLKVFITNSASGTQKLGEDFAQKLKDHNILALYGDLGSGKTTFVQGVAKGLGINKRIISPTFIILRSYKFKIQSSKFKIKSQKSKILYHIDLYRVEERNGIEGLGLDEIIKNKRNVVVIEWAEKMKNLLPKERIDIYFEYLDEDKRKVTIRNIYE